MIEETIVEILDHLKTFITDPTFIVIIVGICFLWVISWFTLAAKKHQPLSREEVDILWKSHKQFSKCRARKYEKILKGDKIIGYRCLCGYEHSQKRPIVNFGL